jgi:hypothetical protein
VIVIVIVVVLYYSVKVILYCNFSFINFNNQFTLNNGK